MTAARFLEVFPTLSGQTPLREIRLTQARGLISDIAGLHCLESITLLDLGGNNIGSSGAVALAQWKQIGRLHTLLLTGNAIRTFDLDTSS